MTMPILYGSRVEEEKYFDGRTTVKVTKFTESLKISDTKKALAEFLTLMDRHKAGEITDFSVQCVAGKDGQLQRIENSWVVPDLP